MKNLRIIFLVFAFNPPVFADLEQPIQLDAGQITGTSMGSGVQAFLGIPFASPPQLVIYVGGSRSLLFLGLG